MRSRSVSRRSRSVVWPVCRASTVSIAARSRITSSAARIRSGIVPCPLADGWCSSTLECGSTNRRPGAPAASRIAAELAACPMHRPAAAVRAAALVRGPMMPSMEPTS